MRILLNGVKSLLNGDIESLFAKRMFQLYFKILANLIRLPFYR